MKKVFSILAAVLLTASVFAQSPEKMSYQAVIRNSSDALVTNTQIGLEVNIRQGTTSGTVVYTETQTPTTNANGLVSIEIGGGSGFNTIDWANGPYFIETKTDPAGGTNYTITGTSQLLSVPYALYAKTAETITGGITETDPVFTAWDKTTGISITESQISDLDHFTTADETDPVYVASVASGITATDTTSWNNKLDSETDPVFTAWDKTTGISITESQISDLDHFTTADETDPVYVASVASGITATDTTSWNNKLDSETDPVFTAWDKTTGISITESQISDLDHFTTADETDPVYVASVASGITATDTTSWNNKLDSETDPVFTAWDKTTGISITESQISDLDHFTTADETDPVYVASVASGITATDTTSWNNKLDSETDPVFTAWDKTTGISITESQISDLDHFTTADETDPVYVASVASGITATDTTSWNNKLDSETDPVFTAWDKTTGISITESQISDLDHFTTADETDPVYVASVASGITATDTTSWNNKLDSETDPVFTAWDKTTGISITESQISDLDHFTTADETDPVYVASVASGITATDTTSWNNKLDSETDPVFTAWDKTTGISITESQISDLDHFTTADETDPVYVASVASGITATDTTSWNNKLDSETDPVFTAWDKTTGISITESQISDLDHFTTADETDPVYVASVASGITATDTTSWNNKLDSETDPTVPAHVKAITSDNVSDWNQAHGWGDHSAEGYATKNMKSEKITNLADPTDAQDAATKAYVDAQDAATKAYVDALLARIEALEEKDLLNNGFTDPRDNNHYNVVKIGNQIWMVENLKVTKYNDGIAIPNVTDATAWSELTTGALCDYENTPSNSETYGKLYNWYAVNTGKLCPTGWHLPSDAEWTELTDSLGGTSDAGGKLKETGTTHWNSPNTGATNETGFTALPGGTRFNNGTFYFIGYYGYWWSASEDSTNNAWDRLMYFNNSDVNRSSNSKELGFSVRCLRD